MQWLPKTCRPSYLGIFPPLDRIISYLRSVAWGSSKVTALRCFESHASHLPMRVTNHITALLRASSLMQTKDVSLDPVIQLSTNQDGSPVERSSGLWVLKNPVDRFETFFYEEKDSTYQKATETFRACFPTISSWTKAVESIQASAVAKKNVLPVSTAQIRCSAEQFQKALGEQVQFSNHLGRSLQTLRKRISGNVYVIRNELMLDDYYQLLTKHLKLQGERLRAAQRQLEERISILNGHTAKALPSGTLKIQNALQQSSVPTSLKQAFCCVLKEELAIYFQLISEAVNLPDDSKRTTLTATAFQCGFQN